MTNFIMLASLLCRLLLIISIIKILMLKSHNSQFIKNSDQTAYLLCRDGIPVQTLTYLEYSVSTNRTAENVGPRLKF